MGSTDDSDAERFDPATNGFSSRPPLATPPTLAAAVPLRDGKVLLIYE